MAIIPKRDCLLKGDTSGAKKWGWSKHPACMFNKNVQFPTTKSIKNSKAPPRKINGSSHVTKSITARNSYGILTWYTPFYPYRQILRCFFVQYLGSSDRRTDGFRRIPEGQQRTYVTATDRHHKWLLCFLPFKTQRLTKKKYLFKLPIEDKNSKNGSKFLPTLTPTDIQTWGH